MISELMPEAYERCVKTGAERAPSPRDPAQRLIELRPVGHYLSDVIEDGPARWQFGMGRIGGTHGDAAMHKRRGFSSIIRQRRPVWHRNCLFCNTRG